MPLGSHASCLNIIRLGHPETFTGSGRADPMKSTDRERDVAEIYLGNEADFEEEGRRVITKNGLEIGVFRINGNFFAYENHCAHQGGPVCQGRLFHKVEENLDTDQKSRGLRFSEDQIHIVCPWHGYEYDIETGIFPANPKLRLRKYDVEVRGGEVYVLM